METSSRKSKSIVTCGRSRREAGGAVWAIAIESFEMRILCVFPLSRPVALLDQKQSDPSQIPLKNTSPPRTLQYCEIKR